MLDICGALLYDIAFNAPLAWISHYIVFLLSHCWWPVEAHFQRSRPFLLLFNLATPFLLNVFAHYFRLKFLQTRSWVFTDRLFHALLKCNCIYGFRFTLLNVFAHFWIPIIDLMYITCHPMPKGPPCASHPIIFPYFFQHSMPRRPRLSTVLSPNKLSQLE